MIRSHKPRGYYWNCASPFQQTVEYRSIHHRDCVPPASNILVSDGDDSLPTSERAAKRRRIETLVDDFLNGEPLMIHSARRFIRTRPVPNRNDGQSLGTDDSPWVESEALGSSGLWRDELDDQELLRAISRTTKSRNAPLHSTDSRIIEEVGAQASCRLQKTHGHRSANIRPLPKTKLRARNSPFMDDASNASSRAPPGCESSSETLDVDAFDVGQTTIPAHLTMPSERETRSNLALVHNKRSRDMNGSILLPSATPDSDSESTGMYDSAVEHQQPMLKSGELAEPGSSRSPTTMPEENTILYAQTPQNVSHVLTPIGDEHLNTVLPKQTASPLQSASLKQAIRAEWRRSGAEISMVSDQPQLLRISLDHEADGDALQSNKLNISEPNQASPTCDEEPRYTLTHKSNLSHKTSTDSSTGIATSEKLPKRLRRRTILQFSPESLPSTQTLLDGWKGWSTIKKPRVKRQFKDMEMPYPSDPGDVNQPLLDLQPPRKQSRTSTPKPTFRIGTDDVARDTGPSASAPAATYSSTDLVGGSLESIIFKPQTMGLAGRGLETQNLYQAVTELADDVLGSATPLRAVQSQ